VRNLPYSCLVHFIVSCLLRCALVLLPLMFCFQRLVQLHYKSSRAIPSGSSVCSLNFNGCHTPFVCALLDFINQDAGSWVFSVILYKSCRYAQAKLPLSPLHCQFWGVALRFLCSMFFQSTCSGFDLIQVNFKPIYF